MIKAEDLRIGNRVKVFINGVEKSGNHVIDADDIKIMQSNKWYILKPIPIIEEWLLKFGFEKDEFLENYFVKGDFMYWVLMNEVIYHKEEGMSGANHFVKSIFYVHDFQNLYKALTNKELTIKE